MSKCFCGCGRRVKGIRRKAANAMADRMRIDLAMFRGGIEHRIVAPDQVPEVRALIEEGEGRVDRLTHYLHGAIGRGDIDKPGIGAWAKRASRVRSTVVLGVSGLGFHGGGRKQAELLYLGLCQPGVVVALRDTGTTINQQPRVEVTLEVRPRGAAPFITSAKMLLTRVDPPRVGDPVEVVYHAEDPGTFAFRRVRDHQPAA